MSLRPLGQVTLARLLLAAFHSAAVLRAHFAQLDEYADIPDGLPAGDDPEECALYAAGALQRRGLVDRDLLLRLLGRTRPLWPDAERDIGQALPGMPPTGPLPRFTLHVRETSCVGGLITFQDPNGERYDCWMPGPRPRSVVVAAFSGWSPSVAVLVVTMVPCAHRRVLHP